MKYFKQKSDNKAKEEKKKKYNLVTCGELNESFDAAIFAQDEAEYAELRIENWSQTAWRNPSCIFQPTRLEQLQEVIPLLVESHVPFAIRSGGHSAAPDAANIDEGILIDLSGFNEVEYDASRNVAVVGSGLRWREVYSQLDQFNVTVVGGRVLDVGVGGLILGGGVSYLSGLYGLACDNVVNFEVVLADRSVVDANETHHADLFWGLKGGGNNFGIVTRFTLSTYPVNQVWAGIKGYSFDDLPALHEAMLEYQTSTNDDYSNLMIQGFPGNRSMSAVVSMIYLKPEESPAAFAPFYRLNTTFDTTHVSSFTEFLSSQGVLGLPPRIDMYTSSFKPNLALYTALHEILTDSPALEQIHSVTAGVSAFGMQPISTNVVEQGLARGGNALGLSPEAQTYYVPYLFMNDASWDQDVIEHYGEDNVRKLKGIQAKYDPDQVFQKLVPGGFKLP
ncbi:hypothetical protein DL764_003322 [Monosporascus ibericus]|uniref:FAD-binding PCMH-type domain-containing protein n=1 Tax=Monosporascus ibericus TaxID=155417 RepID=A0A4Q4TGX6_9PEZI|nr:hypothetical protein DL764_003322 [Monosporascus ibericus]